MQMSDWAYRRFVVVWSVWIHYVLAWFGVVPHSNCFFVLVEGVKRTIYGVPVRDNGYLEMFLKDASRHVLPFGPVSSLLLFEPTEHRLFPMGASMSCGSVLDGFGNLPKKRHSPAKEHSKIH